MLNPVSSASTRPDQRMFMVAYILQNDPPGIKSYYLPDRYKIDRGDNDMTQVMESHSDSYNTLHGEANSVQ